MYALMLVLPLLNSTLCGFFGWYLGIEGCALVSYALLGATALLSWLSFYQSVFLGNNFFIVLSAWIHSGCLNTNWGLLLDSLSTTMLMVVTTVSFFVHVYSSEYMGADPHACRFLSFMSLFTFFMVALVTADNFLQLFFGWEGVGLCSYLLISFWYTRVKATKAALKAVLVNSVADVFIVLGLGLCFKVCQTLNMEAVIALSPWVFGGGGPIVDALCVLLFLGAMGKSAQLGLHTWLPDAMEGPTPVSALMHAATMVTAGVFLVMRCSPIFEYSKLALSMITVVGSLTAFVAATIALVQHDIKKVMAYSTCSQLGYMFFACGLSNYNVGLFHLFNHAFFKALLFLSAGSLIHGMGDEQDMRRLGGTAYTMPVTYVCVLLGSLSLAGFPFLSGFYSKDFILETAVGSYTFAGSFAYWLGSVTALLTAFYSFRLLHLAFIQAPGSTSSMAAGSHEPGPAMLFPMAGLSVGSMLSGYLFRDLFMGLGTCSLSGPVFVSPDTSFELGAEFAPFFYKSMPLMFSLMGTLLALLLYSQFGPLVSAFWLKSKWLLSLLGKKWYFDSFYNRAFVLPSLVSGYKVFFRVLDKGLMEKLGPTGIGHLVFYMYSAVTSMQSGYLHAYLTFMVGGLVILAVL